MELNEGVAVKEAAGLALEVEVEEVDVVDEEANEEGSSAFRFNPFRRCTRTVTDGVPQSTVLNSSECNISKSDSGNDMSNEMTMVPGRQLSADAAAKAWGESTREPSTTTTSACLNSCSVSGLAQPEW